MGWLHDTGYATAYQHEGFLVAAKAAGELNPAGDVPREAVGATRWRAGCRCGWRGHSTYPTTDLPTSTDRVPDAKAVEQLLASCWRDTAGGEVGVGAASGTYVRTTANSRSG
jgi:hypothetical protein